MTGYCRGGLTLGMLGAISPRRMRLSRHRRAGHTPLLGLELAPFGRMYVREAEGSSCYLHVCRNRSADTAIPTDPLPGLYMISAFSLPLLLHL